MKKRQWILGAAVLLALLGFFLWARHRIHFSFSRFGAQLALADWKRIAIALGCIYAAYVFRAWRWAALMRHNKRVPAFSLVGTQVIGFTAVALIGRVADLVRPYLVARKTRTEVSSQIAVYIVERLSDFGSIALIFSVAILQLPQAEVVAAINHSRWLEFLNSHHAQATAAFLFRYGALIVTVLGALFVAGIRMGGERIARIFETVFAIVSRNIARAAGNKIRSFHAGLDTIRSFADFSVLVVLSLSMWALIAAAYYESMRAFTASPHLAATTPSMAVLLLAASGAASVFQLPILGWFSQIGIVAAAISGFFGVAPEAATACAATILVVTFLGVVPIGLAWAQLDQVNLRRVAVESEHAGEELSTGSQPLQ
ncbi:MAG: lysylphosphatidylglycerol synthase transmembrane domain-containing protein [Terracidiphilus sp.]